MTTEYSESGDEGSTVENHKREPTNTRNRYIVMILCVLGLASFIIRMIKDVFVQGGSKIELFYSLVKCFTSKNGVSKMYVKYIPFSRAAFENAQYQYTQRLGSKILVRSKSGIQDINDRESFNSSKCELLTNFISYNYLTLGELSPILGSGSHLETIVSRLFESDYSSGCCHHSPKITKFYCHVFSSGYSTNLVSIPAFLGNLFFDDFTQRKSSNNIHIYSDEKNHVSMTRGMKAFKRNIPLEFNGTVIVHIFKHNDMKHLKSLIYSHHTKSTTTKTIALFVEGSYSMNGTKVKMDYLVKLREELMVDLNVNLVISSDNAHSFGNSGTNLLSFRIGDMNEKDSYMGTFTKSFGGVGGFFVTKDKTYFNAVKEYLDQRPFVKEDTRMCDSDRDTAATSLLVFSNKNWRAESRREMVRKKNLLREKLRQKGIVYENSIDVMNFMIPIPPVHELVYVTKRLKEEGFLVGAVTMPGVGVFESSLRICLSLSHSDGELNEFVDVLSKLLVESKEKTLRILF